ncbi:hypothetical protein AZH47_02235 [Corynebacterium striatum]|nr:hypothetical protein AZH47_02235 [Corynebacterium striatum]
MLTKTKSENTLCNVELIFNIFISAKVIPNSTVIAINKKSEMLNTTLALLVMKYATSAGINIVSNIMDKSNPAMIKLKSVL